MAAIRKFGNRRAVRETVYEMNSIGWLEIVIQDLRYGLRQLRLRPGFAAAAIASLALGIGANTAIFTLVDQILLRLLPVSQPSASSCSSALDGGAAGRQLGRWPAHVSVSHLSRASGSEHGVLRIDRSACRSRQPAGRSRRGIGDRRDGRGQLLRRPRRPAASRTDVDARRRSRSERPPGRRSAVRLLAVAVPGAARTWSVKRSG